MVGSVVGIDRQNTYMWETSWETHYSKLFGDDKSWTQAPPGVFTAFGFANPAIYKPYGSTSYNDVTDDPFGDVPGSRTCGWRRSTESVRPRCYGARGLSHRISDAGRA